MTDMNASDELQDRAHQLLNAARAFHECADRPGSYMSVPGVLESLEDALQVLSGAWYQLAAEASPRIVERRRGRDPGGPSWPRIVGHSREQETHLMATLHDVAAAFARCARVCRDGRSTATPIIARRAATDERPHCNRRPHLETYKRPSERVA